MQPFWESDSTNTYSFLKEGSPELEKELFNTLKIRPKGYYFSAIFRSGVSDGFERYFDLNKKRLLTGLIPYAAELGFDFEERVSAKDPLEEFNLDFQLIDPKTKEKLILNSYQEQSIAKVAQGERRGVFDHITASGKSIVIAALAALLSPLRVTITVPNIGLLQQTLEALQIMLGEEIGQLGGGKKDFEHRVNVMYDGFAKQYEKSPFVRNLAFNTQVLICDELDTITKRMFPFFKKCVNAYYRFGFSGSFFDIAPERIFSVVGYFGKTISTVTDEDTKREGRTIPPHFTFYEYPLHQTHDLEFTYAYEECIVKNEGLNKYFAKLLQEAYEAGKTILVLVKRVEHCRLFQKALADLMIESEQYHGRINTEERREMRAQFKNGTLPVLVATEQTLGRGIDIPRIEVLMNLGGGFADNTSKQKYGRSLRTFEDKDSVEILEPYLTGHKWFIKHSKARVQIAKRYSTGNVKLVFLNGVVQKM